jgi:tetratricopeptide (TPR) repeat protein
LIFRHRAAAGGALAVQIHEPYAEPEDAPEQTAPAPVRLAFGRQPRDESAEARADILPAERAGPVRLHEPRFYEQHELELEHLRLRRWLDRLLLALLALGLAVGAAAVAGLGSMALSAREEHGVVVEAFSVPPALAARGLTGRAVASQLLDKLSAMQARTESSRPARSYRNNWGDDLVLESSAADDAMGGLDLWLHRLFSRQTHVTGEAFETAQGLSLTARADGGGDTFSGGDLDQLLQQSAEAIFRRSQPYRYAIWLMNTGRTDQGMDVLIRLGDGPAGPDRVWANSVLGALLIARGDIAGGLARSLDAVKTAPEDPHAWANLGNALNSLGHAESWLGAIRKSDALLRAHPGAEAAGPRSMVLTQNMASLAEGVGDFQTAASWQAKASVLPELFGAPGASRAQVVADLAAAHDPGASDTARAEALSMKVPDISLLPSLLDADLALGRFPAAVRDGEALQALVGDGASFQAWLQRTWVLRVELAKLAYARAMTGDVDGARVLIASTPLDCYDCLRMRGRIAAAGHDWPEAERWFDQAAKLAPSLPFAWTDWGQMRLERGDPAAAIAPLETAHRKGPRFADALELWGEALMKQGDAKGAAARFAEAARSAPGWARNQQQLREAQAKAGLRG